MPSTKPLCNMLRHGHREKLDDKLRIDLLTIAPSPSIRARTNELVSYTFVSKGNVSSDVQSMLTSVGR
jgi:hypothetical protein